jgi:uncharacterized protein
MHNFKTKLFSFRHSGMAILGLWLGFSLSRMGFSDYGEIYKMFTLADPRLYLSYLVAIPFVAVGLFSLKKGRNWPEISLQKGTVPGSIIFGIGWALTGSCPAVALVQFGEGYLPALITIIGLLTGTKICTRFIKWEIQWVQIF